jgi:hypothetical protein
VDLSLVQVGEKAGEVRDMYEAAQRAIRETENIAVQIAQPHLGGINTTKHHAYFSGREDEG